MFSSGAENGDVTSHSQESGVEVMGNVKKFLLRLARILPPRHSDSSVSVALPRDDVIWSVFSYDNNFECQLSTLVGFFFLRYQNMQRDVIYDRGTEEVKRKKLGGAFLLMLLMNFDLA